MSELVIPSDAQTFDLSSVLPDPQKISAGGTITSPNATLRTVFASSPASLEELDLMHCHALVAVELSGCNRLKTLGLSSSSVTQLINLPALLKSLYLSMNQNLRILDLSGCNRLKHLSLRSSGVTELTNLPASLKTLQLIDCRHLRTLDLSRCSGLQALHMCRSGITCTPELEAQLEALKEQGCSVYWRPPSEMETAMTEIAAEGPSAMVSPHTEALGSTGVAATVADASASSPGTQLPNYKELLAKVATNSGVPGDHPSKEGGHTP